VVLYISEYFNSRVRRVSTAGIMSTVVGTDAKGYSGDGRPATSAQIGIPGGMAIDASGRLYLADPANGAIRLLTPVRSICSGSVSSAAPRAPAAGGTLVLTITADSTCGWTISTPREWVTIVGPRSGNGTALMALTRLQQSPGASLASSQLPSPRHDSGRLDSSSDRLGRAVDSL
jgi:hypothetical protein